MSTGKVLLGVLAGLAGGAALGILYAPDNGKATRKRIIKKGDEYVGELDVALNTFMDKLTSKLESITVDVRHIGGNGRALAAEALSEVNNIKN